ncbi:unnamed protein product [Meganyctiphanes norvegica]|uniref:DRBM domain-containing protein n=1 Tax=Meganyctiphanes norvegica TaxID=48144 RepID=A0AAV2SW11_MEGNR
MAVRRGTAARQMQQQMPDPMEQMMESDEPTRKRPWEKVDAEGNKIKRKKVPGAKNIRIRKHVQPKNALSCLNELVPGVVYNTEQEGGVGQQFGVSVTVEGKTFRGFGSSKQIARQNAAEAAIISFVKPPVPKAVPGEESKMEDKTPWATLASFAMYKLFNDWKDGRIGTCHTQTPAFPGVSPQNLQGYFNQMVGGPQTMTASPPNAASSNAISQYLGTPAAGVIKSAESAKNANTPAVAKPAKQVPDNASAMHPVMVLHQMRPGIQYNTNKTTGEENRPYFYVSVNIDGQEFTGEGPNLKKAKFNLARDAIYALFGVESCFELPA